MSSADIIILGFGKMPKDCAAILFENEFRPQMILETEIHSFSPLKGFCKKNNIGYKQSSDSETTELLKSLEKPTVVFSINNNYIFPKNIAKKKNLRIINFHNSLLPKYPGHGRVIPTWAIFNRKSKHGVTWHLINVDIDSGNILCQREFQIFQKDTALKVMMRAIFLGTDLFLECWKDFLNFKNQGSPQKGKRDSVYRIKDIPNRGYIDSSWNFSLISRFLRGMDYGPFKLMPSPKIKLCGKSFIVRDYRIIYRKNKIKRKQIKIKHETNMKESGIIFLFKEGTIKLGLVENVSSE